MTKRRFYRKGPPPMRIDVSTPVSADCLLLELQALADEEHWSPSKFANRRSYLRRAIDGAVSNASGSPDDLRPVLHLLPTFGPPPDGASSVRKTLSLLLGTPVTHKSQGYRLDEERWAPLIRVCLRRGGGRTHFSELEAVLRAAGTWDSAPTAMPDVPALKAAAARIEMAYSTLRAAIATYRSAREALRASDPAAAGAFAPIVFTHPRSIGIDSLPAELLLPLLRAKGVHDHPADLTLDQLLRHLAPVLHEEWAAWKKAPHRGERPGLVTLTGEYQTDRAVSRIVAGLLLAGRAATLADLSLLSLWTPSEPPFDASVSFDAITERARRYLGRAGTPVLHQPIRVAMDAAAESSRTIAGVTDGTYTMAAITTVQRMWTLTGGVYRQRVLADDPMAWEHLDRQFNAALSHFVHCEATPAAQRDKGKVLDLVSLPQLVCLGLPMLELERRRLRREWLDLVARAREAGHEPAEIPVVRQAHAEYAQAAELRLVPGVYIADGLRLGNYRNGVLGVHYLVELEHDGAGQPIGIRSVTTKWSGADREAARTKRMREPKRSARGRTGAVARRTMPCWHQGHVPHDALWEYLEEVTLPRAKAAGVVDATATVADLIAAKCVPIFISKTCRPGNLVRVGAHRLGVERAGKALWWTAKRILGRDIPEWEDLDRTRDFFRILVGHDLRLHNSCYWGKVRDDWEFAAFLTNDKVETLKEFYSADAYARWAAAGGDRTHWDHPKAFDAVMDQIRDYSGFVPRPTALGIQIPPAMRELLAAWQKREQQRGKRGSRSLLPAARIRRARPGQLPPQAPDHAVAR